MELTDAQAERYSRNMLLEEIGPAGQEKLLRSKVLVLGAGGLGSPALLYLAAAGVGTLGIADSDAVELHNLQRQVIHCTADVGDDKVSSAARKVAALNPDTRVLPFRERVRAANILDIIAGFDFIVDGSDNFATKFLVNDACFFAGKPFSHAGILRFLGQAMTYVPGAPCYRCVFIGPPPPGAVPSCREAGVIGAVAGLLGCVQAAEAVKYVTGAGRLLAGRLLVADLSEMEFREVAISRNPSCPLCGDSPSITDLQDGPAEVCEG
ncbi:MAG: ThiF family adenylyltransferase [bacterium]|nr:ThiF family adenylyltransferase [bacterium]